MSNRIEFVRPTSTFETFEPQNEQQEEVRDGLKKLAHAVRDKLAQSGRLDHAKLINLHGKPGRGKTHLVEAFLNVLKPTDQEYQRRDHIYLLEGTNLATWEYNRLDNVRVLAVDDLFQNKQELGQVSSVDIKSVMIGLYRAYEKRQLVLTTSNFPTNGIVELIKAQDQIGRIRSRLSEMAIAAIELTGEDYRERLAEEKESDPFSL